MDGYAKVKEGESVVGRLDNQLDPTFSFKPVYELTKPEAQAISLALIPELKSEMILILN